MACWGSVFDSLKAAIAASTSFQSFIAEWGGTPATAEDHVYLHDWPDPTTRSERYEATEMAASYKAYALLRAPDEGGWRIRQGRAINTAFIGGKIQIEIARLVPVSIRDDNSAVLQQAITTIEPIACDIAEATDGTWQSIDVAKPPWRTHHDEWQTYGDYHGLTLLLDWGHPQRG